MGSPRAPHQAFGAWIENPQVIWVCLPLACSPLAKSFVSFYNRSRSGTRPKSYHRHPLPVIEREAKDYMKLSRIGRIMLATVASLSMGLGMTACGGGTIGYLWVMAGKTTTNGSGNSITGFKIDDYTGNLTEMVHSPFSASGSNPTMAVLKPGGRFLYVLNQGDAGTGASSGITEYTVGGDGVLTFQQTFNSQGTFPQWIQLDSSGSYLYALDKLAPGAGGATIPAGCAVSNCGSITVFAVAGDTGRLTLVTNNSIKVNNVNITYYPTGQTPFMSRVSGSGSLLVVNSDQTVTAYNSGTSGQLTICTCGLTQATGATSITSITNGGNYVYLTDGGTNQILPYTINSGALTSVAGGNIKNFVDNAKPVWTVTDSRGKFVYVLNQTTSTATNAYSSISAYTIDSNGKLTKASGINNPYPVGAGPVCIIQDPSNKYIYTSNSLDSTVTGFEINQATGELNTLRRGSTFSVTGKPACLVASGNVS